MSLVFNHYEVVYFAVRSVNDDGHERILQLAAKFERGKMFSQWITLPTSAAHSASKIEGLEVENDKMFLRNEDLKSVHLIVAIWLFIRFLDSSTKPVLLVTYDQATAIPLLVRAILEADRVDQCRSVILGYRDSLEDFLKKMPVLRRTGRFALRALAKDILKEEHMRNDSDLLNRLQVLEKLVMHFGLRNQIMEYCRAFQGALEREMEAQYSPQIHRSLVPLKGVLTLGMIKKIAEAGVSYSTLERVFQQEGSKGLERFLSEKQGNGEPRVTDSTEIKQKIIQFFDDGTVTLRRKHHPGNYYSGPSSSKRHAMYGFPTN